MSISLYKPNSKNAGCAFNFKIGVNRNKEPVVYISAIQQYSWDDKRKTGNFSGNKDDPDKNINLNTIKVDAIKMNNQQKLEVE